MRGFTQTNAWLLCSMDEFGAATMLLLVERCCATPTTCCWLEALEWVRCAIVIWLRFDFSNLMFNRRLGRNPVHTRLSLFG
ncbi:hypothetical protein BU16DRAFT_175506 [Lophium mytilinum]|uniref:Uncharacterized protein n=1 Tax=Lophium mytilinum TaxID=390894 RepID=A0A6A6QAB6_9PEZI|nr:hypothetical protein BU16DRAFT_175506 [Lophium mytilinum]